MQIRISCVKAFALTITVAILVIIRVLGIEAFGDTALKIGLFSGAMIGLYILVRYPGAFLALYFACLILVREFVYMRIGPVYATEGIIALLLARLFLGRKLGIVLNTLKTQKLLLLPFIGFFVMGLFSLVRGYENGMLAARDSVIVFYSITTLIVIGLFKSEHDIHRFLKLLIVIGALYDIILYIKLFTEGFGHSEMAAPRLFAARSSAFLFLVGSLAVTGQFGRNPTYRKYLKYFGILQFSMIILLSGTRNVWIASVSSFIFWILFFRRRKDTKKSIVSYFLIAALFVGGILAFSREQYSGDSFSEGYERAFGSILDYRRSANAMNRVSWWKDAISITINENPIWGKPFGSMTLFMNYSRKYGTEIRMAFHNSFITVLYFMGFLGLIFLLIMVYKILRIGWINSIYHPLPDSRQLEIALTLSFFFYCIVANFNVILEGPQSAMLFWLIPGLILVLGKLRPEMNQIAETNMAV